MPRSAPCLRLALLPLIGLMAIGSVGPACAAEADTGVQRGDRLEGAVAAGTDLSGQAWITTSGERIELPTGDWLLIELAGHGLIRTRGLATGPVFQPDGVHVATVAQECLLRDKRYR